MKRDKKADELIVMRHFIEKYPEFPKGKLIKQESPDFKLSLSKRKHINIELTQLVQAETESFLSLSGLLESLEDLILKKKEKLSIYNRNKPYQNWLIIYCDNIDFQKAFKNEKPFAQIEAVRKFEKAFLFDLFSGKIIDLC